MEPTHIIAVADRVLPVQVIGAGTSPLFGPSIEGRYELLGEIVPGLFPLSEIQYMQTYSSN